MSAECAADLPSCMDTSNLTGKKIEVYWSIVKQEGTEQEQEECVWWPGVVGTPVRDSDNEVRRGGDGQIVYTVEYEDYQDFAAECCQVSFLNQHVLRAIDDGQCMAWRSYGSSWSDVDGALAEFAVEEDVVLTASEVLERQASEMQEETGFTSVEEGITHLQATVPRDKLIDGARAMNEFAQLFKAHLEKTAAQAPPADGEAFVVTKEVVHDFVAQMGRGRAPLS